MAHVWLFIILCIFYHSLSSSAQCTSRGRFPNQLDECRGYTMCISGATGFMEYNLTCPDTFIYSHIDSLCTNVTSYICLPQYNCTGVGNFESDSKDNCTAFIACVEGIRGMVAGRWMECPQGTLFSPIEKSCVNETLFKCNKANNKPNTLFLLVDDVPTFTGNFSSNTAPINYKYTLVISFALMFYKIKQ